MPPRRPFGRPRGLAYARLGLANGWHVSVLDGSVSCVLDVVAALLGLDGIDEGSEVVAGVFGGTLLGIAHPMLDLCEGLFDRVEVLRVRRQEPQLRAGAADCLADRSSFVAGEVVEEDDVAGPRRWDEELLDPGLEASSPSTNIRLSASSRHLSVCHRARLRATAARVCSWANRIILRRSPARPRSRQIESRHTAIPCVAGRSCNRSIVKCGVSTTTVQPIWAPRKR